MAGLNPDFQNVASQATHFPEYFFILLSEPVSKEIGDEEMFFLNLRMEHK